MLGGDWWFAMHVEKFLSKASERNGEEKRFSGDCKQPKEKGHAEPTSPGGLIGALLHRVDEFDAVMFQSEDADMRGHQMSN